MYIACCGRLDMSITAWFLSIWIRYLTIAPLCNSKRIYTYWQCGSWMSQRPQPNPSHHREAWAGDPFPFHSWRCHCSPVEIGIEIFCALAVRVPFCVLLCLLCALSWFPAPLPLSLSLSVPSCSLSLSLWVSPKPVLFIEWSSLTSLHVLLCGATAKKKK